MTPVLNVEQPTASSSTVTPTDAPEIKPISKNAQKRIAKTARIAEQKKERRAYEKEKKKEKKRQLAAKRAAGELEDEGAAEGPRKKAKTEESKGPKPKFQARIVVDLGFDDLMSENEIKSLTSQLAFTYSANRKAPLSFSSLLFTSVNGKTHTRLESISNAAYKRWDDTEWWQEGYEKLWEAQNSGATGTQGEDKAEKEKMEVDGPQCEKPAESDALSRNPQMAPRESVVYLTADAEEELTELSEGETYIIGGICDHNRYKNLCLDKAQTSGIRAARLPIGTHLAELRTRKVLTVNQAFEILLKWVETRDWRAALEAVIPKRKFGEQGRGKGKATGTDNGNLEAINLPDSGRVIVNAAELEGEDIQHEELEEWEVGDVATAGGDLGDLVVSEEDPGILRDEIIH
ncbi:hypothetical protein EW026_g4530 [Hermanssonia centrifuga]|uniref:tRNA (guanine(9)-N1)-methyltransferase n=1 Tax=Hermanssonia centrifuga TaxID=98765 RepID=A0A4S4KGW0_9APHY|nr:hypothetical protein EW026_g4530 [Hermanssonia centrifuga]